MHLVSAPELEEAGSTEGAGAEEEGSDGEGEGEGAGQAPPPAPAAAPQVPVAPLQDHPAAGQDDGNDRR